MAISRPFLLALLGVVLLAATFVAASGGDDASTTGTPSIAPETASAPQPANAAQTQPAAVMEPTEAMQAAAASADDVKTGRFEVTYAIRGVRGGLEPTVRATGAFDLGSGEELPKLDAEATVRDMALNGRVGFVSTGDAAWFTEGDVAYRVPPAIWKERSEARAEAQAQGDQKAAQAPPSLYAKAESSEGPQIDGVQTTHIHFSSKGPKAFYDLARLQPAGPVGARGLQGLAEIPPAAIGGMQVDVYVGSDGIVRQADLRIDLAGRLKGASIRLAYGLSEVNDPQTITAPANVERGLPGSPLGLMAFGLVQGLAGERPSSPAQLRADLRTADNPRKLKRAVRENRKAVLFLHNPDAIDDRATAAAVNDLRGRRNLVVLADRVGNADRYGSLVEELGVTQAPAIVIFDRRGKAHLLEGYTDPGSLAQEVADAR